MSAGEEYAPFADFWSAVKEAVRWIGWRVWSAVVGGLIAVVLVDFGAPLWLGLSVGVVYYSIAVGATSNREP